MEGYKEINTSPTPTIEVDLETNKKTKVFAPDNKEVIYEDVQIDLNPQEEQVPVEPKQKVEPQERKKPTRANLRIRELNTKANQLEAQLEQERKEKAELLKRVNQGSRESLVNTQTSIKAQIGELNNQMRTAMQSGDTDTVVTIQSKITDLQDQMADAKINLKVAELESNQIEEYKPIKKQQEGPSPYAVQWVEDHPEFQTDAKFNEAAMRVNSSLINEGYSALEEDFYEELNYRLQRRFPQYFETFVAQEENSVEYTQVEPPSAPKADVKPQYKTTVSGASRSPSAVPNRQPLDNKKVNLTPEDQYHMERMGIPLQRMARRKHHIENNRRDDGYVTILLPNETE